MIYSKLRGDRCCEWEIAHVFKTLNTHTKSLEWRRLGSVYLLLCVYFRIQFHKIAV